MRYLYILLSLSYTRFAIGVSIWAAISVVQTLFWVGVYAPVVEDKLAQFTDICSLANIRKTMIIIRLIYSGIQ